MYITAALAYDFDGGRMSILSGILPQSAPQVAPNASTLKKNVVQQESLARQIFSITTGTLSLYNHTNSIETVYFSLSELHLHHHDNPVDNCLSACSAGHMHTSFNKFSPSNLELQLIKIFSERTQISKFLFCDKLLISRPSKLTVVEAPKILRKLHVRWARCSNLRRASLTSLNPLKGTRCVYLDLVRG